MDLNKVYDEIEKIEQQCMEALRKFADQIFKEELKPWLDEHGYSMEHIAGSCLIMDGGRCVSDQLPGDLYEILKIAIDGNDFGTWMNEYPEVNYDNE